MAWIGLAAALALLVALVLTGVKLRAALLAAQADAAQGRDELLAGAALIKQGGAGLSESDAARAEREFVAATAHFERANGVLARNRLIAALALLPGSDRQVEAGRRLTDMGIHLGRVGSSAAQTFALFSARGQKQAPGEKLLAILDAVDPKLNAIGGDLRAVQQDRLAIPSTGLLPPVHHAVDQFDAKFKTGDVVNIVTTVTVNEGALRQILGTSGPRTYLVLQQDPAELRGTGGFIGSVGFLSFDHGRMAPFSPQDVYEIDGPVGSSPLGPPGSPNHVDAPYALATVFKLQSWSLRDSNWSPDFPTAAQEAELLLAQEAHRHVDGVIAIDPYFISQLLAVIGPTKVPETGDIVTSANFYATTLQRVHPERGPAQGKSFLSQAANAIFGRLVSLPSGQWAGMLQALQSGCSSRSLQAYFHAADAERFATDSACSGRVRALTRDGLMVVESNIGGNKDDFWMKRHYRLRLEIRPDGSVVHTLALHYDGLSAHGPLTGTWGYTGWLRVYLPPGSSMTTVSRADLTSSMELGRQVLQGWFYVQFDSAVDVILVYRTDAAAIHATNRHIEVFWQKQAGRQADPIDLEVALPDGWKLVRSELDHHLRGGSPVKTDLSVDRDVQFWYAPA